MMRGRYPSRRMGESAGAKAVVLHLRGRASAIARQGGSNAGFWFLCALTLSTLLHLSARFEVLGTIHFDLMLGGLALLTARVGRAGIGNTQARVSLEERRSTVILLVLVGYVIVTLPFVQWPGSVLKNGMEPFAKAIFYYFLCGQTLRTPRQMYILLFVFVGCELFRIYEPLYLHVSQGYWGSSTYMDAGVFLDRLSGAPSDIINANGLAWVVISTLPFVYFFQRGRSIPVRLAAWILMAGMINALLLTRSRSGLLLLLFLIVIWIWNSKRRALGLAVVVLAIVVTVATMPDLEKSRYLSIVQSDVPGGSTAQLRIEGVRADLEVAMRRPLFGYGLGTSKEANSHFRGTYQLSHDLYTEVAQELGFVGLSLFIAFLIATVRAARKAMNIVKAENNIRSPLRAVTYSIYVTLWVFLVFSFASYGLSEMYCYLLAGLSVALLRIVPHLAVPPARGVRDPGRSGSAAGKTIRWYAQR